MWLQCVSLTHAQAQPPPPHHVAACHTQFLCQNQVLIVCIPQDQLFHTYRLKVLTDNQML
jgi:hypothetical protein